MPDLSHTWGGDLSASPSGDLALVDGPDRAKQRILRRLLTATGSYIWQLDYGAGVPSLIGTVIGSNEIVAAVRSQIMKEQSIARNPLPVVTGQPIDGGVFVSIQFMNVETGVQDTLQFNYLG